jgi:hypothetical protein
MRENPWHFGQRTGMLTAGIASRNTEAYDIRMVRSNESWPLRKREHLSRRLLRKTRAFLKRLSQWRGSEPPEDPYSYVGAPKKPRSPRLSASAVAELPDS